MTDARPGFAERQRYEARITVLADMHALQFKRVKARDAEIVVLKARVTELEARLNETAADRMMRMIRSGGDH